MLPSFEDSRCVWWLLFLGDTLINMLLLAPLVVGYWRGTWNLIQMFLLTEDPASHVWVCVVVGNVGSLLLALLQNWFKKTLPLDNKLVWLLACHPYTYVAGLFSVCLWKGVWNGLDHYTGRSDTSYLVSLAVGLGLLLVLRSAKMIVCCPGLCSTDTHPDFFTWTSRFQTQRENREQYFLDHVLTVMLIWNCVVFVWRGVWGLTDNNCYPDNLEHSAWLSLVVGYGLMLICVPLQIIGNVLYQKVAKHSFHKYLHVFFEDFVYVFANMAAIQVWRGIWLACDAYIYPNQPANSSYITHFCGIGLLMVFLAGNSVLARGCYTTGDGPSESGCLLPNRYLRHFISTEPSISSQNSAIAVNSGSVKGSIISIKSKDLVNGKNATKL